MQLQSEDKSIDMYLAVAQAPAALADPVARLDWLEQQLDSHRQAGFDLLVLPELFVCSYNIGDDVKLLAEPADGPIVKQISALARRFNIAMST
jgi:predicted amidohydrolase